MNQPVYLDYAAATPLDSRVRQLMEPYLSDNFYNPSAAYLPARKVKAALEQARSDVAGIIGSKSIEIVFTAGGTEANNLAIRGVMEHFPGMNVVVSAIEHESIREPAKLYDVRIAPVSADGIIDVDKLAALIDDKTVLVSVMYANNEVGTIQPIRTVADCLQKIRLARAKKHPKTALPLYFHSDACQAAGFLDLHVSRLGLSLMTLNGGKIYGPKQSGALYIGSEVRLSPQILGGGQENSYRSGTENPAGSIGFAAALTIAQQARKKEVVRLSGLQELFVELLKSDLSSTVFNGSFRHRLPNNIHITLKGTTMSVCYINWRQPVFWLLPVLPVVPARLNPHTSCRPWGLVMTTAEHRCV
jgi:cysteine desulfurase